jgi:hypothetical protein
LRKAGGEGFTDFKMKVGGAAFEVDVARVRAAHEAIGPGDRLALDANNVWRCPYEAIRFAGAVEDRDIWWLEEPRTGHSQLQADPVHGSHGLLMMHWTVGMGDYRCNCQTSQRPFRTICHQYSVPSPSIPTP